jgi:hypothetical protein
VKQYQHLHVASLAHDKYNNTLLKQVSPLRCHWAFKVPLIVGFELVLDGLKKFIGVVICRLGKADLQPVSISKVESVYSHLSK